MFGRAFAHALLAAGLLALAACGDIASSSKAAPLGGAYMRAAPEGGALMVAGSIGEDFSDRLERALNRHPAIRVMQIESGGGLVSEARKASALLNARRVGIRVTGRCASACALLWAATDRRELVEGARIGLHEGVYVRKRQAPDFMEGALRRHEQALRHFEIAALRHAGFSDRLIDQAAATPHESVLWLSPAQLEAHGVRFDRAGRAPNPVRRSG